MSNLVSVSFLSVGIKTYKMENKYYTPKLEQFVVGFKYELQDDNGDWLWSNAPQDKELLEKLIKDGRCRALANER